MERKGVEDKLHNVEKDPAKLLIRFEEFPIFKSRGKWFGSLVSGDGKLSMGNLQPMKQILVTWAIQNLQQQLYFGNIFHFVSIFKTF